MELAQDASFFSDIAFLMFGAGLFMVAGVALGYMISHKRYVGPLTQLETELRRMKNEQILKVTFGDPADPGEEVLSEIIPDLESQETEQEQNREVAELHQSSSNQIDEEPVLDTIAEWTQKIFDMIDPADIIDPNEISSSSGDSDSVPVEDVNIVASADPEIAEVHPENSNTDAPNETLTSTPNNTQDTAPTSVTEFHPFTGTRTPATVLSLTRKQSESLSALKMNSFNAIARLSPAGIIRLATVINVAIQDIEDVWIPEAEYRLTRDQAADPILDQATITVPGGLHTEGIDVNS